jgi:hypothetical protein
MHTTRFRCLSTFSRLLLLNTLLHGCGAEGTDGEERDLYANFGAIADGEEVSVYGWFTQSTKRGIPVLPEDGSLVSTIGSDRETLTPDAQYTVYRTKFFDAEANRVNLAFKRGGTMVAPRSFGELPSPFTPVLQERQVRRDQALVVELGARHEGITLEYEFYGDCVKPVEAQSNDSETLRLQPEKFEFLEDAPDAACEVILKISRVALGVVDPAFRLGGEFRAVQTRSVAFEFLPGGNEP